MTWRIFPKSEFLEHNNSRSIVLSKYFKNEQSVLEEVLLAFDSWGENTGGKLRELAWNIGVTSADLSWNTGGEHSELTWNIGGQFSDNIIYNIMYIFL